MAWCWPRGGGSLSAGKKMSERSELFFPEERLPPPRGWQNSRAGVPEAGHPEIKTQKNASPKAGVFRSEVKLPQRISGYGSLRCLLGVLFHLVEVEVLVDLCRHAVEVLGVLHVLRRSREFAQYRAHSCQFRRGQVHVGTITQTVREVTGRGRQNSRLRGYTRLVTHAQGAARHLGAHTGGAVGVEVAFFHQLGLVHLGGRRHPQTGLQRFLVHFQQLAGGAEVTDVGHAGADEHFVDLVASHFGQELGIVRIVRAANDRLFDFRQVDLNHVSVFGVFVSTHQLRIGQPGFHLLGATLQGTCIAVAFSNHPAQHHDVGAQVLGNRLFRQVDGTTGCRALSGSVGQFERLLDGQVLQPFDFQDTAREFVDLALLLNSQQALLDAVQRNSVYQVTQGDARLHFAFEANQNGFRHIQRHNTGGCSKRYQARTGREGDAHRETGVGVTTGTHGVRQQHAVQPGVDDAVARTQGNTAAGADKVRQGVLHFNVNRLRISGSVTEGLHHQVSLEAQTRQVFQLVTGHRASGVLGANGGHVRLAVGSRAHALAFFQAAGLADHLLAQGEALGAGFRIFRQTEQVSCAHAQCSTGLVGQTTTDDQRNTAAGLNFVQDHVRLELELGDNFTGFVQDLAFVRADFNHVAHVHVVYRCFENQGAGIFHGVEEDRGNLVTDADTATALVGHARDVFTEEPQNGVGGRLTGRTGTYNVTYEGNRKALGLDFFDLAHRASYAGLFRLQAVAFHFIGGAGVQRDVRAGPGIRSRRQVVGVGFAGYLEHHHLGAFGNLVLLGEPLGVGPGLNDGLGYGVAGVHFFFHVVERVEHQQGVLEFFTGQFGQFAVVQEFNQGSDVVAALHHAQQLDSFLLVDQRRSGFAFHDRGQECSFYVSGFIYSRRYAVFQQVNQGGFFTSRRVFQQLDQTSSLLGVQGLGWDTQGFTFSNVFTIGF